MSYYIGNMYLLTKLAHELSIMMVPEYIVLIKQQFVFLTQRVKS